MNPAEVLRRFQKEKKEWKAMGYINPEIKWTIYGIDLCIKHVKNIVKEKRDVLRFKYPKVEHRYADFLLGACRGALYAIGHSKRKIAMRILSNAMDKVPSTIYKPNAIH